MGPLKNYLLMDGTTRQYREGEQPDGSVEVDSAAKQAPKPRAAKVQRAAKSKGE